jgi:hypothetical protein
MNFTAPLIQRLIFLGLLLTLQPLYGLQTNMEQFRTLELLLRSEGKNAPDDTQFAENQWGRFLENLDALEKFGAEGGSIQSGEQAQRELEEQSENLERVADQIREFFEWYFNVPTPEIDPIPVEDLNERLGRIHFKVDEVLPLVISTVTRGAVLDVDDFPAMMRSLAEIEALGRALRN